MDRHEPTGTCATCNGPLPRGIIVGVYADTEGDKPILGDYCSVRCAAGGIAAAGDAVPLADGKITLGLRVDREGHDEEALARIMLEVVRAAEIATELASGSAGIPVTAPGGTD